MNAPFVSRAEYLAVVDERDRYYDRMRYLERRNTRLGEMLEGLLDARDEFCRLHRMTQITGETPVEPPYPQVGIGELASDPREDTP